MAAKEEKRIEIKYIKDINQFPAAVIGWVLDCDEFDTGMIYGYAQDFAKRMGVPVPGAAYIYEKGIYFETRARHG